MELYLEVYSSQRNLNLRAKKPASLKQNASLDLTDMGFGFLGGRFFSVG